jgi:hypothetical protein
MAGTPERTREVVDVCLNSGVLSNEPPPAIVFELQELGDAGYEEVLSRLRSRQLSPEQIVRALQALAHFKKFGAFDRDLEILQIALQLIGDDDVGVRTKAVHSVVWGVRSLRSIAEKSATARTAGLAARLPTDDQLRAALEAGFERGVLPDHEEVARQFLQELKG